MKLISALLSTALAGSADYSVQGKDWEGLCETGNRQSPIAIQGIGRQFMPIMFFQCQFLMPFLNVIFKGSLDLSHFIFEINLGKSRIRYTTTLKWNDAFLDRPFIE